MESFRITENVPVEHHNIARATNQLASHIGHGALLAYSQIYDSIWRSNYTQDLKGEL